jgi:pyruvate formate lyase activating enzyme
MFRGIQKISLIDYPGKLCCILFTGGCNFRCPYCHNPELVTGYEKLPVIEEKDILDFLKKRKGLLDAVEITGGEPTIHKNLPGFISNVKDLNYSVKLDTNGTNPEMLSSLIQKGLIDYSAMDIKGTPEKYSEIARVEVDLGKISESVKILMESKIPYEFRTTVFPEFFGEEDAEKIGKWIEGARLYILQKPGSGKTLDSEYNNKRVYSENELKEFLPILSSFIDEVKIR